MPSPIQRPGAPRNAAGVMCIIGLVGKTSVEAMGAVAPINLEPTRLANCVVLNASFSRPPIATIGNTAQRNVARRAQPETSSSQQYTGAGQRACAVRR